MIINNYIYSDINILDYNKINTKNIIIEDLIDVKIQINENKINNSSNSKIINDLIKQFDKKLETDKSNKKSISIIESFNNLNMAS